MGRPSTAAGVASLYEGMIDAMVVDADDPDPGPEDVRVLLLPHPDGGGRGQARAGRARVGVRPDARLSDASHGDHPGEALRRRQAAAPRSPRPAGARGARQGDARRRAGRHGRAELIERVIVVTGERRAERIALRRARRAAQPLEVLPRSAGHRPLGGGDAGDRPRAGARSLLRRPAAGGLPAARPGRARRGARAHAKRSGGDRAGPPRRRNQRAPALAAERDRPRLRPGQLAAVMPIERAAPGTRSPSSRSTRWGSTSTPPTTSRRSPRRWGERLTAPPRRPPSWPDSVGSAAWLLHEPPPRGRPGARPARDRHRRPPRRADRRRTRRRGRGAGGRRHRRRRPEGRLEGRGPGARAGRRGAGPRGAAAGRDAWARTRAWSS